MRCFFLPFAALVEAERFDALRPGSPWPHSRHVCTSVSTHDPSRFPRYAGMVLVVLLAAPRLKPGHRKENCGRPRVSEAGGTFYYYRRSQQLQKDLEKLKLGEAMRTTRYDCCMPQSFLILSSNNFWCFCLLLFALVCSHLLKYVLIWTSSEAPAIPASAPEATAAPGS